MKTPAVSLLAIVLCHAAVAVPDPSITNKIGYAYYGTATIDGIISDGEWDAAISQGENIINEFIQDDSKGFTPPTDDADLSGVWYALWDEEALYILLEVWDDILLYSNQKLDSFDIYLSTAYTREYGAYQAPGLDQLSDIRIVAVPELENSITLKQDIHSFQQGEISQNDVRATFLGLDHGYRVEIKLLWAYVMGDTAQTGVTFQDGVFYGGVNSEKFGHERNFVGFDMLLQDSDTNSERAETAVAWNGGYNSPNGDSVQLFANTEVWGTLVLVPVDNWNMKEIVFSEDPWLDMGDDFVFNLSDDQFYYIGFNRFIYSFAEENWWYVHSDDASPGSFFIYDFTLETWFFVLDGFKLTLDEL